MGVERLEMYFVIPPVFQVSVKDLIYGVCPWAGVRPPSGDPSRLPPITLNAYIFSI